MRSTISLLTDFGLDDLYVGVMKGVIARIAPDARLIDISHAVNPHDVRQAAFTMANAYRYFAAGTIFLVIVDPGVGSTRRPIAVSAGDYLFIAPDNGVLSYVLSQIENVQAVELTNHDYWLPDVSNTFHGRDIFASVAAHLANGIPFDTLGEPIADLHHLPTPSLTISGRRIIGEVLHIDRFGNIVTSIGHIRWVTQERLTLSPSFGGNKIAVPILATDAEVTIHGQSVTGIQTAYSEGPRGDFLALIGSSGYLEVAINQDNAASRLDITIGDRVELQIGDIDAAIRH